MQKYHSTLYRKVLLIFVQLLHTNMRNMYISACVRVHHTGRRALQYNILFLLDRSTTQRLVGEVWGGDVQAWMGGACAPG